MAFSLPDRWIWDAWYADDGVRYHVFFLNAPKSVGDPDHRHSYASIGHAVSDDLVHWAELPQALGPAAGPAWDDMATWTGSVVRRPDGRWMLFYTGICRGERGHVQRIGAAVSENLLTWERFGNAPLVEADGGFYEVLDQPGCVDEACRDPFVFADPDGDGWHMLFTASRPGADRGEGKGVIGHAVSPDLDQWSLRPPIWSGDEYAQLEVPELFHANGRWYLLFSTWDADFSEVYRARSGVEPTSGTHYLVSDEGPLGPWRHVEGEFLLGSRTKAQYVARRTPCRDGSLSLIAFENLDAQGGFVGTLTDPVPFEVRADGSLGLIRAGEFAEADTHQAAPIPAGSSGAGGG